MYMKQSSDLARKAAAGRSGTRIYGIPKLDDANLAGSANSKVLTSSPRHCAIVPTYRLAARDIWRL
jgi:hypothetical protein